ncbi:tubulin-specific chaperone cofactor E-like protein [Diadema setosum]|uniref:tubulin-specific chaperone cofactor E-like protein n=1 Tax=Diadema setosum TaxID=31175 RepID=UPI003B3B8D3F
MEQSETGPAKNIADCTPCEASPASSLVDAILQKYGSMVSGKHNLGNVQVFFSAPAKKNSEELVAETPFLKLPSIMVLHRCNVCSAGEEDKLTQLCANVQELDLAENSLSSWEEVMTITSKVPDLVHLNLSFNPLHQAPPPPLHVGQNSMEPICRLVLNSCHVSWETVHRLMTFLPSLEELHLSLNNYTIVGVPPNCHPKLKLLHFNSNRVEDWKEIEKLGVAFPSLETLVLMENPIRTLQDCDPTRFPRLRMLCLSKTLLDSWEEVEKLDHFPELKEVLLHSIPLLAIAAATKEPKKKEKEMRQMVVARLHKVVSLNRSAVTEKEREEAERMFVRKYYESDSEDNPQRYEELLSKHGTPQVLANVDLRPKVKFNCKILHDEKTLDYVVDTRQNVSQLKKEIAAIVELPLAKFRLFHLANEPELTLNSELRFPNRKIYSYRVDEGDIFEVVRRV